MRSLRERDGELRSALFAGDGVRLIAALSQAPWEDRLQLAGDCLLVALAKRVTGAPELAQRSVEGLRDRAWTGDDYLADQLDEALGNRPAPMLRPITLDLEDLTTILEGDPVYGGGRIDLRTGEIWPQAAIDYIEEEQDDPDGDPDRWLAVWCEGSTDAYHDMEIFIETLDDEDRSDRLSIAISGRGAFRRFKDVLDRWPGELERWHAFCDERQRGRARAWLAAAGYSPRPERHLPS